jgi:hypothetical protein
LKEIDDGVEMGLGAVLPMKPHWKSWLALSILFFLEGIGIRRRFLQWGFVGRTGVRFSLLVRVLGNGRRFSLFFS